MAAMDPVKMVVEEAVTVATEEDSRIREGTIVEAEEATAGTTRPSTRIAIIEQVMTTTKITQDRHRRLRSRPGEKTSPCHRNTR